MFGSLSARSGAAPAKKNRPSRQLDGGVRLAEESQGFQAAHPRHHDVQEDQAEPAAADGQASKQHFLSHFDRAVTTSQAH